MAATKGTTVINVTRQTVLTGNAGTARSLWQRFRGLMGRARLAPGEGLIFPGVQGVHTHFMRFPIDVVFYDKTGTVLEVVHGLRPWRISPYRFRASGVIELPAGTLRATNTRPGDLIAIG